MTLRGELEMLMYAERKVWVAYLAAFPLGVLGIHKFYLRQPVLGCIYFFTGGLLVVGWLYDLVTLPGQVDRCNEKLSSVEDLEELLEEEVEDLEDEIIQLQDEIIHLRSNEGSNQMSSQEESAN